MSAHRVVFVTAVVLSALTACSDPSPHAGSVPPREPVSRVALSATVDFPIYKDTSTEVAEGARLFSRQQCAECHSDAGVILGAGNGDIDVIATAIRDGRAAGMPAYGGKLTDAQIWQLAAFVKDLDRAGGRETVQGGVDLTAAQ